MDILNTIASAFWVAEYSAAQDAFNVDTLANILAANRGMVVEKENNDYLVFGMFRTIQEAEAACNGMKQVQKERTEILCQNHRD